MLSLAYRTLLCAKGSDLQKIRRSEISFPSAGDSRQALGTRRVPRTAEYKTPENPELFALFLEPCEAQLAK